MLPSAAGTLKSYILVGTCAWPAEKKKLKNGNIIRHIAVCWFKNRFTQFPKGRLKLRVVLPAIVYPANIGLVFSLIQAIFGRK